MVLTRTGTYQMKVLVVSEIGFYKRFFGFKTIGGIETSHAGFMKGLRERGHDVFEAGGGNVPRNVEPDLVITPTFGPRGFGRLYYYKRKYKCPCIMHAHATPADMIGGYMRPGMRVVAETWLKYIYSHANALICPSRYARRSILEMNIPNRPATFVLSNGVDLDEFKPDPERGMEFREFLAREHGVPVDKPLVLGVGLPWQRKGIDVFHLIARKLPEYEFAWVGDFSGNGHVLARYNHLENLHFTGYVKDVVAAYNGADVFFFSSWHENQGIPLLEAAACRTPIVTRDLPAYDWLVHGVSCLKGTTLGELKRNLIHLLEHPDAGEALARNAGRAVKNQEIGQVIDKLEKIYCVVVERCRARG